MESQQDFLHVRLLTYDDAAVRRLVDFESNVLFARRQGDLEFRFQTIDQLLCLRLVVAQDETVIDIEGEVQVTVGREACVNTGVGL